MQTAYDDEVCFRAVERIRELSQRPRPAALPPGRRRSRTRTTRGRCAGRHWDVYRRPTRSTRRRWRRSRAPRPTRTACACATCRGIDERPLTAVEVLRARHGYYAAITYMDERVGEVLGRAARRRVSTARRSSSSPPTTARWPASAACGSRCPSCDGLGAGAAASGAAPESFPGAVTGARLAPRSGADAGRSGRRRRLRSRGFEGRSLVAGPARRRRRGGAPVISEYLAEGVTAPAVMVRRGRHKLHPLPRRSRPALRPRRRSARAAQPGRRAVSRARARAPRGRDRAPLGSGRPARATCSEARPSGGL